MMNQSFGARLRAQRERRQVSLAAISDKLKIRVSLLEQLENDRVTSWPKGIFGRAYLRDYAREIGMEPEGLVREFFVRYPQTADETTWPPVTTPAAATPATAPPPPLVMTPPASTLERRREDRRELSLTAAAEVCSRLARAIDVTDITALLEEAARLLDAAGVVVWLWDTQTCALRAALAHGYSHAALARLPAVGVDDANAIAAAYRSGTTCVVEGSEGSPGAVVVPSLGPSGCIGVLALEVRRGGEQNRSLQAFAAILAAQLGMLLTPEAAGT